MFLNPRVFEFRGLTMTVTIMTDNEVLENLQGTTFDKTQSRGFYVGTGVTKEGKPMVLINNHNEDNRHVQGFTVEIVANGELLDYSMNVSISELSDAFAVGLTSRETIDQGLVCVFERNKVSKAHDFIHPLFSPDGSASFGRIVLFTRKGNLLLVRNPESITSTAKEYIYLKHGSNWDLEMTMDA